MSLTIEDAHDLWISCLERHADDEEWASGAVSNWKNEMRARGIPEHNATLLLNKVIADIEYSRDITGRNPN